MANGLPARQPRRRFPPNVYDLSAPQYALPETRAKSPRQRKPAAAKGAPVPRRLTPSEERLALWMKSTLGFRFGARNLVRQYGTRAILEAVHDGVMIWQERRVGRYQDGQRIIDIVDERVRNPAIISPPAYLCHLLRGLDVR